MKSSAENKKKGLIVGISFLVFVCLCTFSFFPLKFFLKNDSGVRKRQIQRVTLVKPPPPPKIKEKLPEPEVKKIEEIVEPEIEEQIEDNMDDAMDDTPPGEDLGLDADGTGGADGFGLKAKKGGRSLIGGSGGDKSLLKRYAWYTRMLQDEIREKVNSYLEDKADLPGGKHKMLLWIMLDDNGNMVLRSIPKSSGILKVDDAVEQAIAGLRVSEMPPEDMPKLLKIKVTFKS
ncbi:TonB C-terminal domain-containing protein [uncultured Desulfobacter sp.]|uniref:TonB C-terminal domain-containing protein n=1 Tax=uncultured Desulfobacter sp. TaxID=240139 RepID=UPI0029F50162|nr:TonB C-terminal domain-containing protein [uncultured Desulfobacter sp.]